MAVTMDSKLKMAVIAILLLSTSLLLLVYYLVMTERNKPIVIGKVERVGVEVIDTLLKARIDTGAGVTSLNARIVEVTKSATPGQPDKVKFEIKDDLGHAKIFEKEVVEWQQIKNKGEDGYTERPVVKLDLCLGGKEIYGRVNLVDRSNFKYQLLIGRNFLETGDFVVDASTELTSHRSRCK
jgi:hypothetical protein